MARETIEQRAARLNRGIHMLTYEKLRKELAEIRAEALEDAVAWVENVGRHTSVQARAESAFECANVIRARARDGS